MGGYTGLMADDLEPRRVGNGCSAGYYTGDLWKRSRPARACEAGRGVWAEVGTVMYTTIRPGNPKWDLADSGGQIL